VSRRRRKNNYRRSTKKNYKQKTKRTYNNSRSKKTRTSTKSKDNWKKRVKDEQNYICLVCGKEGTDQSLNIHHKKAKSRGGTNSRENVVAWHRRCHNNYHEDYGNRVSDDYGNPI